MVRAFYYGWYGELTGITSSSPGVAIDGSANNDSIDILDNDTATPIVDLNGPVGGIDIGPFDYPDQRHRSSDETRWR